MASNWGETSNVTWKDRKRVLGMPITFTRYYLVEDPDWTKVFVKTGLLFTREEEVNLYRIYDISLTQSLGEKIFGGGTIVLYSKDESTPTLVIRHIKNSTYVRNLLADKIEEEKVKRGFRVAEFN